MDQNEFSVDDKKTEKSKRNGFFRRICWRYVFLPTPSVRTVDGLGTKTTRCQNGHSPSSQRSRGYGCSRTLVSPLFRRTNLPSYLSVFVFKRLCRCPGVRFRLTASKLPGFHDSSIMSAASVLGHSRQTFSSRFHPYSSYTKMRYKSNHHILTFRTCN